ACAPRSRGRGQRAGRRYSSRDPHCGRPVSGRAASSACQPRRSPHARQAAPANMMAAAPPWQRHSMSSMTSSRQQRDLGAWIIVGFCFLVLAVSFSARSSLSLVMTSMEKELGWSSNQISNALALVQIAMAVASPIMGNFVDRFSPRLLLSSGLAIIGCGILLTSRATETWQLNLAYGVVAGIGF